MTKKLINYLVLFVIFSGGFVLHGLTLIDLKVSYIIYIIIFLLFIFFYKRIIINKKVFILFLLIFTTSVVNILLGHSTFLLLIKQIFGLGITYFTFIYLIKYNDYQIENIFKVYLNLAFIIALIGLFQQFSYLIGFEYGYNFSWVIPNSRTDPANSFLIRVNSILAEPSHLGLVIMPAFYVAISSFFSKKKLFYNKLESILIILVMFLTFSSSAYLGMIFAFVLFLYNIRKISWIIIGLIIIILLFTNLYIFVEPFNMRVSESIDVLLLREELINSNLSTFTLFTNALIAWKSFSRNPLFGSGLGSHNVSYSYFIDEVVHVNRATLLLNQNDANSLFLRILSELGIFGILIFAYFIFKNHIHKKTIGQSKLFIINNSILVMFFMKALRMGHYFNNGFILFVLLYYYSNKQYENKK